MDHPITIGMLLEALGGLGGVALLFLVLVLILWFAAQGWNH